MARYMFRRRYNTKVEEPHIVSLQDTDAGVDVCVDEDHVLRIGNDGTVRRIGGVSSETTGLRIDGGKAYGPVEVL